ADREWNEDRQVRPPERERYPGAGRDEQSGGHDRGAEVERIPGGRIGARGDETYVLVEMARRQGAHEETERGQGRAREEGERRRGGEPHAGERQGKRDANALARQPSCI